jgi:hypothetical protein
MLHSQFRVFATHIQESATTEGHARERSLASPKNLSALKKCPVILASTLERPGSETAFATTWALPPKQHGTVGIVVTSEGWHFYSIEALSKDVQERQKQISQKLEGLGTRFSDFELVQGYEETSIFAQDTELRDMLQQLAQDYYQYHQATIKTPSKRTIPQPPTVFKNGFAETASCLPFQAVLSGIQDATRIRDDESSLSRWRKPEGHPPSFYYEKPKGNAIVEYMTGEKNEVFDDKTTASLWRQVKQFSDADADVVLALFAHLIRPSENDGTTWFLASQFLDYRGLIPIMKADTPGGRKRRAGHRPERIKEIGESIGRIENIWITLSQWIDEPATSKKKRKRTEFTHKGRFLMVEEVYTQRELPEGDADGDPGMEIGWRIRPGSWLRTFLESPNRQVALLCQKSLRYDPYRQQWEKRLSRYFMFHGHINTHGGGGTFNRHIGKLLQEMSLEVNERFPQRTRDRFEKAMNMLVADKIIQEWAYEEEISPKAKGWLAAWLNQKIIVHIAPTKGLLKADPATLS